MIQNAADTLTTTMDTAHDSFDAGKMTRQDFYTEVKAASAKSQALADFTAKITRRKTSRAPTSTGSRGESACPGRRRHRQLHREQRLGRRDKAAQLEKDAQTEMLTAHAAEQKAGLWSEDKSGRKSRRGQE